MSKTGKNSPVSAAPGWHVALGEWFGRHLRILPWRDEPSLYRVWVSEIMLQQTQVVTVVPYFEKFMARFPNVESLAVASSDDVMLHWAGLGYYSRARNLHAGSQAIVAGAYGAPSAFPCDREGWLSVKGVGEYTAGAILSIALNLPEAILDGNVERVLSRIFLVDRPVAGNGSEGRGDAAYKAKLWELSRAGVKDAFEAGVEPRVFNQALMELGAMVCTPRSPLCALCPVSTHCQAYATLQVDLYPPRKKPKTWVNVQESTTCLIDPCERVLVERRPAGAWRAGLWDLPVNAAQAAPTEERLGHELVGQELLGEVETKHVVTRHKITRRTEVWRAPLESPSSFSALSALSSSTLSSSSLPPLLRAAESGIERRWVSLREPEVAVGSALKRTLQAVRERFF